jgi:hypothetical protein
MLETFDGVRGTGGIKTALPADEFAQARLVEADQSDGESIHQGFIFLLSRPARSNARLNRRVRSAGGASAKSRRGSMAIQNPGKINGTIGSRASRVTRLRRFR